MGIVAFKMYLKPGHQVEYQERHSSIWPELKALLHEAGICDYYIFLDAATDTLFAVQNQTLSGSSQDLGKHAVMQRWWDYMADLMLVKPDNSPVSTSLEQVFFME